MTPLLLLSLLLVAAVHAQTNINNVTFSECGIHCLNSATCALGPVNRTGLIVGPDGLPFDHANSTIETSRNGYHCACPVGLTGLRCGRIFESCNIGGHVCYNNGKCIEGLQDIYGNSQLFCDCGHAMAFDHELGLFVRYGGKFCEKALSQKECHEDPDNFCLNGGTCRSKRAKHHPCKCAEGFTGRHCEFHANAVPNCTLPCENNGKCRLGSKNDNVTNVNELFQSVVAGPIFNNYQHCECPSGYMGALCDVKVEQCGMHQCFHGSECKELVNDQGVKEYYCDCTTADADADKDYAGVGCQHSSTKFCTTDDDPNGRQFCVNDGECPEDPHGNCICPTGYFGPRCEFHSEGERGEDYVNCTASCKNGGVCKKGIKAAPLNYDDLADMSHVDTPTHSLNFEHCACPQGYTGLYCEEKVEVCGNGLHVCFHGAHCVDNGLGKYTCDCTEAEFDGMPTAGISCQHRATDMCSDLPPGADVKSRMAGSGPRGHRQFCTNHGVCLTHEDGTHSCQCPNGFDGLHCEQRSDSDVTAVAPPPEKSPNDKLKGGAIFGIVVACVFVAGVVAIAWRAGKRRRDLKHREILMCDTDPMSPISRGHDEEEDDEDEDGRMEDVEVI